MIRALVGKELRQHAVTFAFMFLLLLVALAAIAKQMISVKVGGIPGMGLQIVLYSIVPLACVMLGHILIASEFGQRTQLFLDALPLHRWRFLVIKYLLGLFVLSAGCAVAFGLTLRVIQAKGTLTSTLALNIGLKTALWVLFVHSVFFLHAMTGRYRIPVAIATFVLILHLNQEGFHLGEFAPFQLVDHRFAVEAHHIPFRELWITLASSLALVAVALWLGLARDATLAGVLAARMSAREKVLFTFLITGGFFSLGMASERRERLEVVRMPGAFDVEEGIARVSASVAADPPTSTEQKASRKIASELAAELHAMAEYLGCKTLPPVFLVHRRDFAADRIEKGDLKPKQGLLLRANLATAQFSERMFLERVIREVLLLKSSDRAGMERNAWVLDGFPSWWLQKRKPDLSSGSTAPPVGKEIPELSENALRRWFSLRKTLGEAKARAVAHTGLAELKERVGEGPCRSFLASMLAADVPKDARGWIRDVTNPMPRRFRSATNVSLDAFARGWHAALVSASPQSSPAE